MARQKVYILQDLFSSYAREQAALAEAEADGIVVNPWVSDEELIETCRDADGVLADRRLVTRAMIFAWPRLKVISVYGIGTEAIDIAAATERKIPVANLPGFCAEDVSEHAIALLLAASRKIVAQNNQVKSRQVGWTQEPFRPIYRLAGKTLGLVGLGNIGRTTARKAQGLGMHTLAYDPYVAPAGAEQIGVELVGLRQLFQRADHISVHVGLTAETEGMIDGALLSLLKPTSVFINTSRGKVVNQDDLIAALRAGRLAAAGVDVVREDPPSEATYAELLSLPNVIVTPHTAWYSEESIATLQTDCARNAALVLQGRRPSHTVNPEVYS